jgi:hypothetical protein
VTGDAKTQAEGAAEKAAGKVQNAIGGAKDAVRDAVKKSMGSPPAAIPPENALETVKRISGACSHLCSREEAMGRESCFGYWVPIPIIILLA